MAGGRSRQHNTKTKKVEATRNVNLFSPNTANWNIGDGRLGDNNSVSRGQARTIVGDAAVRRMEQKVTTGGKRQTASYRGATLLGFAYPHSHGTGSRHGVAGYAVRGQQLADRANEYDAKKKKSK